MVDELVSFNASASTDPDGTIISYSWNFGDGTTGTGVTISHSWIVAGNYTIILTVTDNAGATGSATSSITVNPPSNIPPTADAGVGNAPNPTGKRVSVVVGDTVYFDGSTYSSDPDGTITKYEWDFENDGVYDWSSSVTGVTTHIYPTGAGYTAKLRVTDNKGATTTDTVSIDRVLGCACEAWIDGYCGKGEGAFNDDFETYNLGNLSGQGGWLELDGYTNWKVANTKAYDGLKSIYIDRYYELTNGVYKYGSGKSSGIQSAWIYFSGNISGSTIFSPVFELLADYQNYWLNVYGIKYNTSTLKWEFVYYSPVAFTWIVLNPDVSKNNWHLIEAKFDEPNWRYQLRLDSGVWSDWIPFHFSNIQGQTTAISGLRINARGQEVWVDAIDGEITPSCLTTKMSRNRTCRPAGCSTEFDCEGNAATCGAFFPPPSFDWSHKVLPGAPPAGGADWMSPVKNQGTWDVSTLFASTGVMEAKYNIQNNNPNLDIDLSEQYMDSCLQTPLLENMLRYTGGPTDEACLPYQGKSVPCSDRCVDWNKRLWDLTGVNTISGNRDEIKYALINYGPLRVTMDMTDWNPITYSCVPILGENHVAVIVGYDDAEGVWIVRNSWGPSWGTNGYFKVKYGQCLIDDKAVAIDGVIAP